MPSDSNDIRTTTDHNHEPTLMSPQFNISDHKNRVPQNHSNAIFPEEILLPEFLAKYRNNNESENSYTWRKRTASTPNKSVIIICVYLSVLFCPS